MHRREFLAAAGAAAAIRNTIGSGAVPGEANEQTAIMSKIGRPPILRVRHQRAQIFDYGIKVELFKLLCIIKIFAHRIGQRRVLAKGTYIK